MATICVWPTNKGLSAAIHPTKHLDGISLISTLPMVYKANEFNTERTKVRAGECTSAGFVSFNEFFPDSVRRNEYMMPVIITGLRKLDVPVNLPQSFSIMKEIEIPAQDNVISSSSRRLTSRPGKECLLYKLEGSTITGILVGRGVKPPIPISAAARTRFALKKQQ